MKIKDPYNKKNHHSNLLQFQHNKDEIFIYSKKHYYIFPVLIILIALVICYMAIFTFGINNVYDALPWCGLMSLAVFIIGKLHIQITSVIDSEERTRLQQLRNEEVENLIDKIAGNALNDIIPFSIYLRPFIISDKIHVTKSLPRFNPLSITTFYNHDYYDSDFESIIAATVERFGLLVALEMDENKNIIGFGKTYIKNKNWKKEIAKIVTLSSLIVTIPIIVHEDSGTLWEIQYLSENELLYKTIFIMPPQQGSSIKLMDTWNTSKSIIEKKTGITIPGYTPLGAIFNIGTHKSVCGIEYLNLEFNNPYLAFKHITDKICSSILDIVELYY